MKVRPQLCSFIYGKKQQTKKLSNLWTISKIVWFNKCGEPRSGGWFFGAFRPRHRQSINLPLVITTVHQQKSWAPVLECCGGFCGLGFLGFLLGFFFGVFGDFSNLAHSPEKLARVFYAISLFCFHGLFWNFHTQTLGALTAPVEKCTHSKNKSTLAYEKLV